MTQEESAEARTILQAVEAVGFDAKKFVSWLDEYGAQSAGIDKGTFFYRVMAGHVGLFFKSVGGVSRVINLGYTPQSDMKTVDTLVGRGRSASGKSLSPRDLVEVDKDYSFEAIPQRVIISSAMAVEPTPWAVEDVTPATRIVDDLLDGDDDEFEREYLLRKIFEELEHWFTFDLPDLAEQVDEFDTVQDIITYVQQHFRGE